MLLLLLLLEWHGMSSLQYDVLPVLDAGSLRAVVAL